MVEEPLLVTKIVAPNGNEIPLPERAPKRRAMSDAEAYMTIDLLKSVVDFGTGQGVKVLRRPIVGKTGTSNEVRDAWFAGFSTEMTCVVWTGFDDDQPLGAGEAGARTSLPAFVDFMRVATEGTVAAEFPVAPGITRVNVDPKTGLLARADQEDAISEAFLQGTEPSETAPTDDSKPPDAPPPSGDEPLEKTAPLPEGPSARSEL
jgi:penicillin-binding protein 1A